MLTKTSALISLGKKMSNKYANKDRIYKIKFPPMAVAGFLAMALDMILEKPLSQYHFDESGSTIEFSPDELQALVSYLQDIRKLAKRNLRENDDELSRDSLKEIDDALDMLSKAVMGAENIAQASTKYASKSFDEHMLRALLYQSDPDKYSKYGHRKLSVMTELKDLGYVRQLESNPNLWGHWELTDKGKDFVAAYEKGHEESPEKEIRKILEDYVAGGLIWAEGNAYVGKAGDGEAVQLGEIGGEKALVQYLKTHPDPKDW